MEHDILTTERLEGNIVYINNLNKDNTIINQLSIKKINGEYVCEDLHNISLKDGDVTSIKIDNCNILKNSVYEVIIYTEFGIYTTNIIAKSDSNIQDQEKLELEAEYDKENNQVILNWDKPTDLEGFKYYKIVHSITNSNLQYPEDGYIAFISNITNTQYNDIYFFEKVINYYRITYVYEDKNVNGEVIKLDIGNNVIYNEKNTVVLADYESINLVLGDNSYQINMIEINEQSAIISINGESKTIKIYSGDYIYGVYVYLNDLVYSSRDSVKSYVELITSLQEVKGDFFCSDIGSNVLGYESSTDEMIELKSDYCIDSNSYINYFCGSDEKTIESNTIKCDYGCSNGECEICSVNEEDKLDNTFILAESENINLSINDKTFIFKVHSVGSSKVLISVQDSTYSYDSCEVFEIEGITFQINDLVESYRDDVSGYVEIGYKSNITDSDFGLTDTFNFGEDQSSHNYKVEGTTSSGAYTCSKHDNIDITDETIDKTLRLSNCAHGDGAVYLDLNIIGPSNEIKFEIQEATSGSSFGIEIDGIDFGIFTTNNMCEIKEIILTDDRLYNVTYDGIVTVKLYEGVTGSCEGDPQFSFLNIYSKVISSSSGDSGDGSSGSSSSSSSSNLN